MIWCLLRHLPFFSLTHNIVWLLSKWPIEHNNNRIEMPLARSYWDRERAQLDDEWSTLLTSANALLLYVIKRKFKWLKHSSPFISHVFRMHSVISLFVLCVRNRANLSESITCAIIHHLLAHLLNEKVLPTDMAFTIVDNQKSILVISYFSFYFPILIRLASSLNFWCVYREKRWDDIWRRQIPCQESLWSRAFTGPGNGWLCVVFGFLEERVISMLTSSVVRYITSKQSVGHCCSISKRVPWIYQLCRLFYMVAIGYDVVLSITPPWARFCSV